MATFTIQDLNTLPVTTEEDEAFNAIPSTTLTTEEKPSMSWNHRVVDLTSENGGEPWLEIQEVYYNSDGQPCGYCDPTVGGESIDEIQLQIRRFTECLAHPILNAKDDFNNKFNGDDDDGKEEA